MNISNEQYKELAKKYETKSPFFLNLIEAFLVGGSICLLGQGLIELYKATGFDKDESSSLCSMTLVLISAVMTATGLYSRLAKIGEAGTLVPITGFANGIASSAIEFKAEGWISGIGSKIFAIAGPVILYGTACSVAYGVVLFTMHKLG